MSDVLDKLDAPLSVEAFERIDHICELFEGAWRSEHTPYMEAYLSRVEGLEQPSLFHHLLRLDLYYRRRHGSDPLPGEYDNRFPESTELISAVFLESADDHSLEDEATQPAIPRDAVRAGIYEQPRPVRVVTCPRCGSDLDLTDRQQQEITCVNCGSTVEVDPKATTAYPLLPKTIGRFEVIERLGQGSFGVVYKAHDPDLKLTVAIKMARPETLDTPDKLARFLRDARSAARLKHPHIIQAHDIAYENGVPYIVSEFIEGVTLDERVSGRAYTFHESAELVARIADALEYAHAEKVVHRDVKPSNIVIDRSDKPFLTDFGLAYRDEEDIHLTLPGQVVGTPAYMSPEQARGEMQDVDARSDLYSLGVVLFELLTGELPFRGKRRMLLHQVQHEEPPRPRRLNDQVPRDLETICLKCLEKEPAVRYPSGRALHDDLRRYLRDEPIQARPITAVGRSWRWVKRNRLVTTLVVMILLLLGTVAGMSFLMLQSRLHDAKERFYHEAVEHLNVRMYEEQTREAKRDPFKSEPLDSTLRRQVYSVEQVQPVIEALEHGSRYVRKEAAVTLGIFLHIYDPIEDDKLLIAIETALQRAPESEYPDVRRAVTDELERYWSQSRSDVEINEDSRAATK